MPATEPSPFMSPTLPNVVSVDGEMDSPVTRGFEAAEAAREAWERIIDRKLIEWGRDPGQLEDDGATPPARRTVRQAIALAQAYRVEGYAPPDTVVPDPNGGIVFERREKEISEVLHVWEDGAVEYCRFQGTRLVERLPL